MDQLAVQSVDAYHGVVRLPLQVDVRSSWVGAEGEGDILRNFTDVSRDRQADVVYVVVADCCAVAVAEEVTPPKGESNVKLPTSTPAMVTVIMSLSKSKS